MGNPPACNWISRRFVVFARLFSYFFTTRHRRSPPRPPGNDVCAAWFISPVKSCRGDFCTGGDDSYYPSGIEKNRSSRRKFRSLEEKKKLEANEEKIIKRIIISKNNYFVHWKSRSATYRQFSFDNFWEKPLLLVRGMKNRGDLRAILHVIRVFTTRSCSGYSDIPGYSRALGTIRIGPINCSSCLRVKGATRLKIGVASRRERERKREKENSLLPDHAFRHRRKRGSWTRSGAYDFSKRGENEKNLWSERMKVFLVDFSAWTVRESRLFISLLWLLMQRVWENIY